MIHHVRFGIEDLSDPYSPDLVPNVLEAIQTLIAYEYAITDIAIGTPTTDPEPPPNPNRYIDAAALMRRLLAHSPATDPQGLTDVFETIIYDHGICDTISELIMGMTCMIQTMLADYTPPHRDNFVAEMADVLERGDQL